MLVVPMLFAAGQGRPASVLYALVRSICACAAGASARCCVPVITHGGNPVTVLPGLIAMSALIVPPMTQVNAVPAMIPFGAAAPRLTIGAGAVEVTVTVAVPEIVPLVAFTVLLKVPVVPPEVKRPVLELMDPPPFTTDQTGEIATTLPLASRPVAANCCEEFVSIEAG